MARIIYSALMVLLTIAIVGMCADLTYSHEFEGAGLHPLVAGGVSVLAVLLCILCISVYNQGMDDEFSDEA